MKDLIFNELTTHPLASDFNEAFQRVKQFICAYKKRPPFFNKRIRLDTYIGDLQLTGDMSLQQFCNETPQSRTLGSALLGLGKHPFIDQDTPEETQYLEHRYTIKFSADAEKESIGLAAAYLNDAICIGFQSEARWKEVEHQIIISNEDGVVCAPVVLSVSKTEHFKSRVVEKWIEARQPVSLLKSAVEPREKPIALRNDHGEDILRRFSKRLRRSPYVTAIVNSLPFNPNQRNFIKSTDENGLIEIVLTQTDQGLGVAVQTTGRNISETKAIAEILKSLYA